MESYSAHQTEDGKKQAVLQHLKSTARRCRTSARAFCAAEQGELAAQLQGQDQVLCVVNARTSAQEIFQRLKGEGNFLTKFDWIAVLVLLLLEHPSQNERFYLDMFAVAPLAGSAA